MKYQLKEGWEAEIKEVSFEDLQPLARLAKRERLSFKPTKKTNWFGIYIDGDLAGCGGVIWPRVDTARLKSDLLQPEWRGLGGYRILNRHRINFALDNGAQEITVITRHKHVFRSYGFTQIEGKGATHMHIFRPEAETLAATM